MTTNVDLRQLAVDRQPQAKQTAQSTRRWFSRFVLPFALLVAFVGLMVWATKESLLPAKPVTVVPVVVSQAQVQQSGAMLFQAAGWIEPRPTSIVVSSLAPGVIDELLVVEGQLVKKGECLASLLDTDAKIRLEEARATRQLREAEAQAAQAELESARLAIQNPVALEVELADAKAKLAGVKAELETIPIRLSAAKKRQTLAEQNVANKRRAREAISGRSLRDAEAALATTVAEVEQLSTHRPILTRQLEALQEKVSALTKQLELKLDERRRLAAAEASYKAADAKLKQSEVLVRGAELELRRMNILSPLDGRVLSVQAVSGMRLAGIDPHSEKGASAVVTLYEPDKLQVRVDVRLENIPQIYNSQRVRIETAASPGSMNGNVVGVTSRADIQKNTLQVKVAIEEPSDLVRPEMLAQVKFLAREQEATERDDNLLRVLVPSQLVTGSKNDAYVWIAHRQSRIAERRAITLGGATKGDLIEVVSGLTVTDKLISGGRESLEDGDRIRITSEDDSMGVYDRQENRLAELPLQSSQER